MPTTALHSNTKGICRRAASQTSARSMTRSATSTSMLSTLPTTTLPDGRQIAYVTHRDVQFIYQEIYEERQYERAELHFPEGGTVVDAGANVGLFSLYAAAKVGPKGRVVSLEPIPRTYQALQQNINALDSVGCITAINEGISDGSITEATFRVYSTAAGWSTMHPDDTELAKNLEIMLSHALPRGYGMPKGVLAVLGQFLITNLPGVYKRVEKFVLWAMVNMAHDVTYRLTTLSNIIEQLGLEHIDLLKVDVEGAELDVLRGLKPQHWPLVQQVALEVHDRWQQLQQIVDLLRQQGFKVDVGQDTYLQDSKLYAVLAWRETT